MFRITRTSTVPGATLEITFNEPIQHAPILATPADASGKPTFEAIVPKDVADHIRADAGLSQHFSVSPLKADKPAAEKSAADKPKTDKPKGDKAKTEPPSDATEGTEKV